MKAFATLMFGALLIVGCGSMHEANARASPSAGVLFENVRIFDGTLDRLSAPSNLLVVGNVIQQISTAPIPAPPDLTVARVAGGGRTLMPGLIDNHVHITMSAWSQHDALQPDMTPEKLEVRAAQEAEKMLMRGFTAVRENLRFGASQIKVMAGGGAATAYDPLDVTQYTADEVRAAVEAADDWNTYVTVHAYTPRAVRRAVEAGVKCVEHGQLLEEETIALLGERGIWLSLQVRDPAPPTAPAFVRAKKQQVVDGTDKAYAWAKKYGVKLAWGTDMLFDPRQNAKQTAEILKLRKWFTPSEILRMVTHDNAQLLALSGNRNPYPGALGVVETGALADLLLVDGDPLANLDLLKDPETNVMVIMKDGRLFKHSTR